MKHISKAGHSSRATPPEVLQRAYDWEIRTLVEMFSCTNIIEACVSRDL